MSVYTGPPVPLWPALAFFNFFLAIPNSFGFIVGSFWTVGSTFAGLPPGYMLDIHGCTGSASSLGWFPRLVGPVLGEAKEVPQVMGKWQSPPPETIMGGSHKYSGVLPVALRGLQTALLSPPHFHLALSWYLTPWRGWTIASLSHQ
jgi:hypothetical protein